MTAVKKPTNNAHNKHQDHQALQAHPVRAEPPTTGPIRTPPWPPRCRSDGNAGHRDAATDRAVLRAKPHGFVYGAANWPSACQSLYSKSFLAQDNEF